MSGTWSKLKKTLSLKLNQNDNPRREPLDSQSPAMTKRDSQSPAITKRDSSSSISSSSSSLSRFSRSFNATRSSKKTCAVCLGNMKSGQGQAIFTAECSHSFHFSCIVNSVKHGNHLCPICRSKWTELPFQLPNLYADANCNNTGRIRVSPYRNLLEDSLANHTRASTSPSPLQTELHFNDDEPLPATNADLMSSTSPVRLEKVTIQSFTEFPAIAASDSMSSFAVLISLRGPPLLNDARHLQRAPIDLVAVLDVSGSMSGSKLILLKRAVHFVIENMGPSDRLSIVSFSSTAQRIVPLRRMTDRGREEAKLSVNLLRSSGGTDIVGGLKKGVQVLEQRRVQNPVASIMLLSDGKDTQNYDNLDHPQSSRNQSSGIGFLSLLPVSICPGNRETRNEGQLQSFPVLTFGFGLDHDSSWMHAISDASGGTFSFVESVEMVQDAFARCIGGLLSVVAQDVRLTLRSASPGLDIEIESIPSGKYASEISRQGKQGIINAGDLYADEVKEFLVHLSIPGYAVAKKEGNTENTPLMDITCAYRDSVSKEILQVEGETVGIRRPNILSPTDMFVNLEVDRHRNRMFLAESIAGAKEMAELGNLEGAKTLLTKRRAALLASASAQAGDGLCNLLEAELTEIAARMASKELYENTGRAYVLSGLSSHSWQRATTRGDSLTQTIMLREGRSNSGVLGYDTPTMVTMVSKSQNLRVTSPL